MGYLDNLLENGEQIDEKQLPELIQSEFNHMMGLRKEITNAISNAYDAKECVINEVSGGHGKKAVIENLQSATLNLANSQLDAMKAQKKSFEYQQKLGEISKFLFRLGLTNISMNRIVVSELEMRLRNASEEELDDLARAEIKDLLKQLKAQQDVSKKQEDLTMLVKEHDETIRQLKAEVEELKATLCNLSK